MNNMNHLTGEAGKGRHHLFSNYIYFIKSIKDWDKWLFLGQYFMAVPLVGMGLLEAILPSALVSGLTDKLPIGQLLLGLGLLLAAKWICAVLGVGMHYYFEMEFPYLRLHFLKKYVAKITEVDYELLEDEAFKHVADNVWGVARFGRGLYDATAMLPELLYFGLGVLVYGAILCSQSVLIIIAVIISLVLNLYLLNVARKKHRQYIVKVSKYAKHEDYISLQSMDSAAGKDIRIYRMLDWFLRKYDESLEQIGDLYRHIHNWYTLRNVSAALLTFGQNILTYGLLIYFLVEGKIDAAGFVFYIGLVTKFSESFEQVLRQILKFNTVNTTLEYIRSFEEVQSEWGKVPGLGEEAVDNLLKTPVEITLRNVSYTYPGNEAPTIKNINLTIKPGEKLALIGLNGAGKTTLVKLICGFYKPTEGEILLNNIPIRQFQPKEYYRLISVLFQDATLLPMSVDVNIAGGEKEYIKGVSEGKQKASEETFYHKALRLSGFLSKYESLPKKGATPLVKKLNEDAAEFSGGELQKLLFARAIYKQAALTILDEPTAALDPIAENELYQHYGEAVEGRTSLYISHRLSSTRFCDRIVLLEQGGITEEGTHESLLAAGGRYAELFGMQSKYYREQEERKQRSAMMGDEFVEDRDEERGVFHE